MKSVYIKNTDQKGLAPILIVLIIALAVGGYFLYQGKTKLSVIPQSVVQSSSSPEANPVSTSSAETANWKIYKNSNLGFELKYPDLLYSGLEKQENVTFGYSGKGGAPIPYLTITEIGLLDYKNLFSSKCLKYQGLQIEYCVEKGSNWNQEKDINDIKLDEKDAKSFYVSDFTCKYHIVQTISEPFIELRMCISRDISDEVFKQILSTFKFLNVKQESLSDISDWKTYKGESSYSSDGSSAFIIKYPPGWELKGNVLYPLGNSSIKGALYLTLGSYGIEGGGPSVEKNFPAGMARYYWYPKGTSYATFSIGKADYIFDITNIPEGLSAEYEVIFNKMLSTFSILKK